MRLEQASQLANRLIDYMRPACDWIYVAGSVRRESAEVKDLEIVCIPSRVHRQKDTSNLSLFQETVEVNELHEVLSESEFIEWIKPGVPDLVPWHIKPDGKYWRGFIPQGRLGGAPAGIKLDLFLAHLENFGVIYTIRTGAADFSRALVTYARDKTDYRVDGGKLKRNGFTVPCPDEETLFNSLGLEWIDPRLRRDERDLVIQQ